MALILEKYMLRTTFNSIQDMLEYNQAIQSTLEMLWEYEAEKWNETNSDKLCDPAFYNIHIDEMVGFFLIPCWLSCDVTYDEAGWAESDPYTPYTVEISVQQVVEYLKENYGYD